MARAHGSRKAGKLDARNALTISGGAALTLGVAFSPALDAATFTVTNLNDAGAGSLRQAIVDANGAAGADIVAFQPGLTGTITLTTGQLYITDSVDVQGPGPAVITVSGNNASRVFYLYNGSAVIDVTISGLTITEGSATIGAGVINFDELLTLDNLVISENSASGDGGGIWADGTFDMSLTIRNTTITGNTAGSDGGGIYVEDTGASLLIENTVISGNTAADDGGGIYFYDPDDSTTIRDSTISGNTAGGLGGGIYLYDTDGGTHLIERTTISGNSATAGGGIFFYGPDDPFVIESSTISGNSATSGDGGGIFLYSFYDGFDIAHSTIAGNSATGEGGGLFAITGPVNVDHCIVADNTAGANPDLATVVDGSFDISFSLVEAPGSANITDNGGNVFNQDPQLGALANNGGPTQTHLPAALSPAVNAGDAAFAPPPATDQRGLARVRGGRIDIGAVELAFPGVVQFTVTAVAVNEADLTLTLTVTRTGGTDGAISVNYAATPGTAVTPGDYTLAGGTLNWADGDGASKTFNITIVNDLVAEPAETFTVALSTPVGTTIGANALVTVTINASAGPASEPIPTLGWWAKLAMMIGTAFAGLWALGRRLLAVTLFSLLAAGVVFDASAAATPAKGKSAKASQIKSVSNPNASTIAIELGDGSVVTVPSDRLEVTDHRAKSKGKGHGKPNSLDGISADQPAVVTVKTDGDGNVKRVRVKLYDSLEKANAGLEAKK